jgi:hypothetical protein
LGAARHYPDFGPADFVEPTQIGSGTSSNPYLPLIPGSQWLYAGGDERVTVTGRTKLIEGVTCIIVNDVVEVQGQGVEDPDDWFAQDASGNIWYCGEAVQDFATLPGNNPPAPERSAIDGSFKGGRDHAKPGLIVK